jgi:hypothetical protein
MAQLRADIHQAENEKKRKRDSEKLQEILPIIESDNREIINIESQDDVRRMYEDLQDTTSDYITTEEDWKERLEEWSELLIEEEKAQNLAITEEPLNSLELDGLLSSYTHPAIDTINGKWDLRDLFIRDLEKPEFISVSPEFN